MGAALGVPLAVCCRSGPGARLWRNEGGLRFTDVTEQSGITHRGWSFGVASGDVDGDRRDDLLVGYPVRFFPVPADVVASHLGLAVWAYEGAPFAVVQLV